MPDDVKTPVAAHKWPRHPDEWYVEEAWCDRRLFDVEPIPSGMVYDPCCGRGNVLDAAAAAGHFTLGADIADRGAAHPVTIGDAFDIDHAGAAGAALVSNPPYKRAPEVVERFVGLLADGHFEKVCLLLPATFFYANTRVEWNRAHPPARIWILCPRPSMPPGDYVEVGGKVGGGTKDFAWHVWTAENLLLGDKPTFDWLQREDFRLAPPKPKRGKR